MKGQSEQTGKSSEPGAEEPVTVTRVAVSRLPTEHGELEVIAYRDAPGAEHLVALKGKPSTVAPLVRLHSECLTGDVFGSLRCDCGDQLRLALDEIAGAECGALIYLRQEGRGIGLGNKIRAYALQDQGLDTVDANHRLGFAADLRDYRVAAAILTDLGIGSVRLLTNNPAKVTQLEEHGIQVTERLPLRVAHSPHREAYLATKAAKLGHEL